MIMLSSEDKHLNCKKYIAEGVRGLPTGIVERELDDIWASQTKIDPLAIHDSDSHACKRSLCEV